MKKQDDTNEMERSIGLAKNSSGFFSAILWKNLNFLASPIIYLMKSSKKWS